MISEQEKYVLKKIKKEKEELQEKFNKLSNFIYSDKFSFINSEQSKFLIRQSASMVIYLECLKDRIEEFEKRAKTNEV